MNFEIVFSFGTWALWFVQELTEPGSHLCEEASTILSILAQASTISSKHKHKQNRVVAGVK